MNIPNSTEARNEALKNQTYNMYSLINSAIQAGRFEIFITVSSADVTSLKSKGYEVSMCTATVNTDDSSWATIKWRE